MTKSTPNPEKSTAGEGSECIMVDNKISNSKPSIINLSNLDLTETQIKVLEKSSKFCPTPIYSDLLDLEINTKEFLRKVQLKTLASTFRQQGNQCLVKEKGAYIPPECNDPFLAVILTQMKGIAENLEEYPVGKVHDNLTQEERRALNELMSYDDIIIKTADKGASWVILDRDFYVNAMVKTLNSRSYKKLPLNCDFTVLNAIRKLADFHKKCFDSKGKEINYISNFDFQTANFYGNPKIHKNEKIKQAIKISNSSYIKIDPHNINLKFRYICGGANSPTSRVSEYVDLLLKPYLKLIPSYIRDYSDFLAKSQFSDFSPEEVEDCVFVVPDVETMYNNIYLRLGLPAVKFWLNLCPQLIQGNHTSNSVLQLLELVLTKSFFAFNGSFYALKEGTVTGTTVAPTYANLVMAYLEIKLYNLVRKKYGDYIYEYVIKNWKRFLDDGFIVWRKSFGEVSGFINILNSLDENIKFTYESSEQSVSFLNLFIYKDEGKIKTDVFYKDTDSHDYLPFNSCHPRHTKKNIPFTLSRMICSIVTDPTRRDFRLQELESWLLKAGYPIGLIKSAAKKFQDVEPKTLWEKVVHENDDLLVFVQTNNPRNPKIYGELLKTINFLKSTQKYGSTFKGVKVIKSERQSSNLKSLLVHSNIAKTNTAPGTKKCCKKKCGTCKYISETHTTNFHRASKFKTFKIKKRFECRSRNLIYKITCNGCLEYYIGMTKKLRSRVSGHKCSLFNSDYRLQKLHKHIHECAKNKPIPFSITPFYKCKRDTNIVRLATESYFIRKLRPLLNA